jgi:hypothetical protein
MQKPRDAAIHAARRSNEFAEYVVSDANLPLILPNMEFRARQFMDGGFKQSVLETTHMNAMIMYLLGHGSAKAPPA